MYMRYFVSISCYYCSKLIILLGSWGFVGGKETPHILGNAGDQGYKGLPVTGSCWRDCCCTSKPRGPKARAARPAQVQSSSVGLGLCSPNPASLF